MNRETQDGPTDVTRRRLFGLGAAGAGTFAIAACSGPSTSGKKKSKKSDELDFSGVKPAKHIKFWSNHPASNQAYEKSVVDAFNKSQNDTTVELVTAGSSYEDIAQKFQSAQAGGNIPGIVIVSDVWWFRYFMNGSIIPVEKLIDKVGIDIKDYRQTFWDDYKYDGQHWAIPYARSTPIFYYNKKHWKQAGLPGRAPKTWEEFAEWAKKLSKADTGTKVVYEYGSPEDYLGWTMQNHMWGWGGAYSDKFDITLTDDPAVKATEWARDSVYKDKWAGVASKGATDDLGAGACSATIASTGSLQGTLEAAGKKFDVGVGFLPGGPEAEDNVCPTGGSGLAIPKDIEPEEQVAAANFIKFLTSPKNTVGLAKATGYIPVRKSADTSKLIASTPQTETAIKQIDHTRSQDYARVFLPGGDKALAEGFSAIFTQHKDVKTELEKVTKKLEKIYKNNVKPNLKS